MDLHWSEEHRQFRRELRTFLEQYRGTDPNSRGDIGGTRPPPSRQEWQKLLLEKGYTARTVPKQYGGSGAQPDPLISRIIAEEFALAQATPALSNQGISMLVPTLLQYGTEEQKARWIEPTLKGEVVWCQGYSEPGSGSDLASLRTRAELDGDQWVLDGHKIWTSTANVANMMFCLARTDPDVPRHGGISYLLVPMDAEGIRVRPLKTMTGEAEFNEVFFEKVRFPAANIVGKPGQGWMVANNTLRHERGMLGDPDAALGRFNRLVELLQQESLDGEPLMARATFRDRLMKLQGKLLALRSNSLRLLCSDGPDTTLARLGVKLNGCELNHQIAALAIDALGELGTLYDSGDHLRDRGTWQWHYMFQLGLIIGGGTAQIQKNIISERGLNMPKEPR